MPHVAFRAGFHLVPGPLAQTLAGHSDAAVQAGRGLFAKDTATWSSDAAVQAKIANRLGWLSSPALMAESVGRVKAFADGVRRDGFTDVVLLGMGGSSLAPEVLMRVFGVRTGGLPLTVLDDTSPASVRAVAAQCDPRRTFVLVASKSGGTIEVSSFERAFHARA
ncbi:MAG: hypothetical protein ABL982_21845, partial [Vicinamibacterales bacterium]